MSTVPYPICTNPEYLGRRMYKCYYGWRWVRSHVNDNPIHDHHNNHHNYNIHNLKKIQLAITS
jgi:hypothetical protein